MEAFLHENVDIVLATSGIVTLLLGAYSFRQCRYYKHQLGKTAYQMATYSIGRLDGPMILLIIFILGLFIVQMKHNVGEPAVFGVYFTLWLIGCVGFLFWTIRRDSRLSSNIN